MTDKIKSRTPYIDGVVKEYCDIVKKFYPGIKFSRRSSFYGGEQPSNCDIEFSFRSSNLNGTTYKPVNQKYLLHYTSSLQNLFNILNTGFLRLSNLNSLNDPQEFIHMANGINWKEKQLIENFKTAIHSVSFCNVDDLNKPDKFPMWRLYGGDGNGAAILFEVVNPKGDWHRYLMAKVQYGKGKEWQRYSQFIEAHHIFQEKYNYPIINWPEALIAIMGLHKNEIWDYEDEVRFLSYYECNKYTKEPSPLQSQAAMLYHSFTAKGKPFSYLELPLYGNKKYLELQEIYKRHSAEAKFTNSLPILKISKIILGYHHTTAIFRECEDVINRLAEVYKYKIGLGSSYLEEFMR